jgi:hypothetical protein
LEEQGDRITLRWILGKQVVKIGSGQNWLRSNIMGGFHINDAELLDSTV